MPHNTSMPDLQGSKTQKLDGLVRTSRVITADANGELPAKIMLIKAGNWPDSVKGNLTITAADLHQMKMNFDAGVARPGQGIGLPIDFSHNEWDQAAGWIESLEVDGDQLMADVDWSDAGKQAIQGKMFRCISPSFYPAGRGGWSDPEDLTTVKENVLVGAGLTNIPFFKGLSPVKADALSNDAGDDNIIFIKSSESTKETKDMTLDQVRVKDAAALTADERSLLETHKDELSKDEKVKFGFETAAVTADASTFTAEDAKLLADIRAGKIRTVKDGEAVIDASRLTALEDTAKQYQQEKAAAIVASHVERGAIKADQAERWTNRLLASTGEARTDLEADLTSLPSNEALGKELGTEEEAGVFASAAEELADLASKKVLAAKAEGKDLGIADAQNAVLAENTELHKRYQNENKF